MLLFTLEKSLFTVKNGKYSLITTQDAENKQRLRNQSQTRSLSTPSKVWGTLKNGEKNVGVGR